MGSINIANCARLGVLKLLKKGTASNSRIVKYPMELTSVFSARSNISLTDKETALK